MTFTDKSHPLTAGLGDFILWDELYHRLENPHAVPFQVLATAFSDPAQNGTGQHEPVAGVLQYGAGRIFHLILGHVWQKGKIPDYQGENMLTFENTGFQRLLLRGCEWAATGAVTI